MSRGTVSGFMTISRLRKTVLKQQQQEIERLKKMLDNERRSKYLPFMLDEIERLQKRNALLEDVAVAAESALDLWDHGAIKQQAINDLFAALDKLREVGDE